MKVFFGDFTCAEDVFKYWEQPFDVNIEFVFAHYKKNMSAFCLFIVDGKLCVRESRQEPSLSELNWWLNRVFCAEINIQVQTNLRERFKNLLPFV